jgi:hypothetical protein
MHKAQLPIYSRLITNKEIVTLVARSDPQRILKVLEQVG